MNKDNLIPGAHKFTSEENRLGGVNSGISKRAKKRALQIARDILSMPVDDGDLTEAEELSSLKDVSDVTLDVMTSILANMANKALKGDLKASQTLLTLSGDYTTRTEATITLDEDKYDDDHTEYIVHIEALGDKPYYEVQYFDSDYKLEKAIYGEEARRLVDEASKRKEMGRGKDLQFKLHSVRVDDGERITIHSFDGVEDVVIPLDECKKE